MDLDDQDMTAAERALAEKLSFLAADPTPEHRTAIMSAVRAAQAPRSEVFGRWRLAMAAGVAVAVLAAGTVGVAAASTDALPSSPTYPVRGFVEHVRISLATPSDRERLRISFARVRISQARTELGSGDRAEADVLLRDGQQYLDQAQNDLGSLSSDQQGSVQEQLSHAEADQHQAESQLNQDGNQ